MENRIFPKSNFSLEGCLLVAAPGWTDPLYANSVCLIIHHSRERAVGIFLNRDLPVDKHGIWQHLVGPNSVNAKAAIHFGGPHSGPVVAVHDRKEHAEFESADGVYFAAQVEHLKALATTSDAQLRLIVGQADWKSGQLDEQFAGGRWLPLPVDSKIVFADQQLMWQQALREVGNQFVHSITGARITPSHILTN